MTIQRAFGTQLVQRMVPPVILPIMKPHAADRAIASHTPGSDDDGRGTFILSLDTELIWGSFHQMSPASFEAGYPNVRDTIRAILELLDRYEIPATWAVVGHLFLDRCQRDGAGKAHPDIFHPRQSYWAEDWYSRDPCSDLARAHLWYGTDILDQIQAARVNHEIGSHSFAHPRYGDPAMTHDAAAADLDACLQSARARGLELRSFVYPGNSEGFHELLRDRGFRAYRGTGPEEDRVRRLPAPLQRPVRLATQALGASPLVGRPVERLPGLWDIPASMLLLTRTGLRRLSTHQARLRRVRGGIDRAIRHGAVFHLWTHPWNLADDPVFHQAVLRDVLEDVARRRDAGQLRVETMGGMATRLADRSSARG